MITIENYHNFLSNIDWNICFSTFIGALLAFICSQIVQKGIEKRAKVLEEKKEREYRTWQLNYLNNFLYMHIIAFSEVFANLQLRLDILSNLYKNTNILENDFANVVNKIVDYKMDFNLNEENLMFTCDDNKFIVGLGLTKTSLLNYYNAIEFLNNNLPIFPTNMTSLSEKIVEKIQNIINFSLEGIALTIDTHYNMLQTVQIYNNKHDKLLLNEVPPFNKIQKEIIMKCNELVSKSIKNRQNLLKNVIKPEEEIK